MTDQKHQENADVIDINGNEGKQYVSFKIAEETYILDIRKVREFITYERITIIPNLPEYYKGVINLRGSIIPVMDLRLRFGYEQLDYHERTVIMTLNIETSCWDWWWTRFWMYSISPKTGFNLLRKQKRSLSDNFWKESVSGRMKCSS